MRKILFPIMILTAMCGVSCKKYLNINTNPNATTSASPSLVLPLALVNTASLESNMNDYGGVTCGYTANAGGYGGFGATWTYDYQPSQGEGFWDFGYQILENYQYIINSTEGSDANANYNGAAKIMKAFVFQLLVDEFNDIPYSQALQGGANFRPKYDAASAIYPQLASLIDSAIAEITNAQQPNTISRASDPLFHGNMTKWKQFGNSLKLRLIIRASAKVTFPNMTFSSDGFMTSDAIVNPGYKLANASTGTQVNPSWNAWATDYNGSRVGQFYIPAYFVYGYYDGNKLTDPGRGAAIYYGFPNDSVNQLGVTPPANTKTSPVPAGAWYSGGGSGTSVGNAIGVMKGPDMGEPLMLLAESDFLQAEADVRGILTGNAATDFNNGIVASFTYLYKLPNLTIAPGMDPVGDAAAYEAANSGSYLVNFSLATTAAQQIEAIITQKYIANNYINGEESWSEYRRTG
ncbi:MAG TPA: SusD/RagB family nutrient-binding outer membrane lipoprotein, partial [Puia sp.]|nr:SusD/RagB family nutrient-binding outer membrane lipoprotein [Puia sp.]